ncbi:hypothetical protein SDC9_192868 [bioreactor metagenome]|uniref:Uncharacterized protein n=1 Tax=bioreactor metagenome TaxID=1076179 RepID=A0A645I1X1_9ZZZZ
MTIRLNKTYNLNSRIIKRFEKVSENLILLNVTLESDSLKMDSRPLHKRYDFGDFPPLDISFDSETGLIKEITIFVNNRDVLIKHNIEKVDLINLVGYPSFNFDMLKKHEYYYDEVCQMEILLYDTTLYVCIPDKEVQKKVIVNEMLSMLLNDKDEFIGFSVNCLSVDDIQLLKR